MVTQWLSFPKQALVFMCLNPFPSKPLFLRVCNESLLKTLWDKEKLVFVENFSVICIKFNPFLNNPWFPLPYRRRLLKTLWEKEKMLVISNFSFSDKVFLPI